MELSLYAPAITIHGQAPMNVFSKDVRQLYSDTCAIKSQQLILQDFGINISETQLRDEAMGLNIYDGGTAPADVGKLLELHGIGISQYDNANIFNLVNELSLGHKVIVGVDSGELWKDNILDRFFEDSEADHALIVSGVDTSDPNNVKVILTDPGTGDLLKEYPMEQFIDAWQDSNCFMMTTNESVPKIFDPFSSMQCFQMPINNLPMIGQMPYDVFYDNLAFLNYNNDIPDCVFNDFTSFVSGGISQFSPDSTQFFDEFSSWNNL